MAEEKTTKLKPGQRKLVDRAEEIRLQSVFDRDEMGFSTRMFVQCNLPHSDPGDDLQVWTRENGNVCLSIQPKRYRIGNELKCIGYPYGNIPRLILFYVCTQSIQTKNKIISLDKTLSAFMQNIDLDVTGGRWGTINRFKDQFRRLFTASIDFTGDFENVTIDKSAAIASKVQLWWNTHDPNQASLFDSYIELTEEFYNEIMTYPIPVDMGIVSAIKQSPLALDLYTWLTHRIVSITKPTRVPWKLLALQLGADYQRLNNFSASAKEALRKICALWPNLKIEESRGGIILKPGTPSVPMKILTLPPQNRK